MKFYCTVYVRVFISRVRYCIFTYPLLSVEFDLDKFSYLVLRQYVGAFADDLAVNTYLLNSRCIGSLLIYDRERLAVEFKAYRSFSFVIKL